MSTPAITSPPSLLQTVFLVPDAHCPTCAAFIDGFLAQLKPPPASVTTSIVSRTVTVRHNPSLTPRRIAKTLGEAGYEVESTSLTAARDEARGSGWRGEGLGTRSTSLVGTLMRWVRRENALDEETKKKRHQSHCELCRGQQSGDSADSNQHAEQGTTDPAAVVVDTLSSKYDSGFRATVSIAGMSCSSCVGTIVTALQDKPWVTSANVALMTQSASIDFRGEETDAAHLITIIDDLGYEASLEDVTKLPKEAESNPGAASDMWKATYSIEGMTCSSCIGTVTEAIRSISWVQSVNVSLVTNSATVVLEGKSHADLVTNTVEDIGYGATLNDVSPVTAEARPHNGRRSVSIQIHGMYCEHCTGRIIDALSQFDGRVTIEKSPTLDNPIVTISYVPKAPDFTIRRILSAISAVDPEFTPSVYRPPTPEERARQMHARIQRRISYRVVLSITGAIPTFVVGVVYMALVPMDNPGRRYLMVASHSVSRAEWALFAMATPVYFFAADLFHRRAVKELYALWRLGSSVPMLRRFYRFGSMDMLLSFGTTIAYFSSIAELIIATASRTTTSSGSNTTYFDSVVFLTMFLLLGRIIEAYSKAKAGDAVSTLQLLQPREALLVLSDDEKQADVGVEAVDVDMIDLTDIVRVVHGASPPWDGVVVSGSTVFDESSLTGESKPVTKLAGDTVCSGTINRGGAISIKITRMSGDSMLDQIIKVVREGQARRAPIERIADILTSYFVPAVTLVAIATWLIWLGLGVSGTLPQDYLDIEAGGWPLWSLQFAIAVFVIACPCGIGLATPTALFVGGGLAAKHGILVKGGGEAFQEASRLDIAVFDKTGTLTQGGNPRVTDHQFLLPNDSALGEQQILAALEQLEGNSSHPIGKAVVDFCNPKPQTAVKTKHIEEVAGKGMYGSFDVLDSSQSMEILVGNEALMSDHGISLDNTTSATLDVWKGQAKSIVIVATKSASTHNKTPWEPAVILAISDAIRPESRSVIEALARQDVEVWMLSGDNPKTARAVGAMVGIPDERVIAGVLPQQKAAQIQYLQRSQVAKKSRYFLGLGSARSNRRAIVAMVGDGVNDAPALTTADVGIAVGSGSDVAISSADFILVNQDMTTLLNLVSLSRVVFRRVKFNFAWALIYNLLALPIAAGVLYPVKSNGTRIRLGPVWASLAMALSSISVICSSLVMRSRLPVVGFRARGIDRAASKGP
ncbi:hypothetical protein LTR09_002814 [Extremus antarcticus]|uniref:HMA domain-containing protein n=1 Tax=Extremus antarcticus TaxID=702011 RepID=A0AAJ0GF35_9PEZI|nr:hypothetical protein LTR09_002814 [Extremus antarcticus]